MCMDARADVGTPHSTPFGVDENVGDLLSGASLRSPPATHIGPFGTEEYGRLRSTMRQQNGPHRHPREGGGPGSHIRPSLDKPGFPPPRERRGKGFSPRNLAEFRNPAYLRKTPIAGVTKWRGAKRAGRCAPLRFATPYDYNAERCIPSMMRSSGAGQMPSQSTARVNTAKRPFTARPAAGWGTSGVLSASFGAAVMMAMRRR